MLTKYSTISYLPLLPLLAVGRHRQAGWWLAGLAVPLGLLASYELITAHLYGRGLFEAASYHARTFRIEFPGGRRAGALIGLAYAGGSLLPLLFYSPFLWSGRKLLAFGIPLLGTLLILFLGNGQDRLGIMSGTLTPVTNPFYALQTAVLVTGGIHLLVLILVTAWQQRDLVSRTLVLWIFSGCLFATVLNWQFLTLNPAADGQPDSGAVVRLQIGG